MQNVLSDEIKLILSMLGEKLLEDKEYNDHHHHEGKNWEMLK